MKGPATKKPHKKERMNKRRIRSEFEGILGVERINVSLTRSRGTQGCEIRLLRRTGKDYRGRNRGGGEAPTGHDLKGGEL